MWQKLKELFQRLVNKDRKAVEALDEAEMNRVAGGTDVGAPYGL